jgi:hypothetical protein
MYRAKIKGSTGNDNNVDFISGDLVHELNTGKVFILDLSQFNDNTLLKDVLVEVEIDSVEYQVSPYGGLFMN